MTLKNNRVPILCYSKLCASFRSHWWIKTGVTVRKRPIWVKFHDFLEPRDLEIWRMTSKNNRAPLLCYFQLCASFRTHSSWCIETGVTVRKRSIRIKSDDFFNCVTKTIGYLFYATSSFVHHFVTIVEFKLELQSGNAQFGSKPTIIWAVWPSNLTDDLEKQ